jgi:hypothetical protein
VKFYIINIRLIEKGGIMGQKTLSNKEMLDLILKNKELHEELSQCKTIEDKYNIFNKHVSNGRYLSKKKTLNFLKKYFWGEAKEIKIDSKPKENIHNTNIDYAVNNPSSTDNTITTESVSNNISNKIDSEEITVEKKAEIESIVFIDNTKVKNYEQLASLSENLKNQLEILNNKIDSLEINLANLFSRSKETNISDKNTSVEITQMINQILESNNEKISVQINKELLSRAARYIDNKSLIKLETIVKEGHDINSTIVQYILILFIQQNSLF